MRPLHVATRGSALARHQAERVVQLLDVPSELVVVSTRGDEQRDVPIHAMGGTGVFVKEVQQRVIDGGADLAVHSAKDLPADTPPELVLAAVPERGDVRDALVGSRLDDLASGALVGTGSVRRRAQLAALRPDLGFGELRGNIPTRLEKAAAFDAIVVAAVALDRLELDDHIAERLDPSVMLPQVGQGALAVECRTGDTTTQGMLAAIDDADAHIALLAERAFLAALGGGCNLPCGALATVGTDGTVRLDVLIASLDGRVLLRELTEGRDPTEVGTEAARRLLDERGGRAVLDAELWSPPVPASAEPADPDGAAPQRGKAGSR